LYALNQYLFIQTDVPLFFRDLLTTELDAMTTRPEVFVPLGIITHFFTGISTYLTLLLFPVTGGGYLSNSFSSAGLPDIFKFIQMVIRIGAVIMIPILFITGTKTTRFLILWTLLCIAPASLLYYTNSYRHLYLANACFSILFVTVTVQFYRTHLSHWYRLPIKGVCIGLFVAHLILTITDESLMDYRSRTYQNMTTSFQEKYANIDEKTPVYLVDGNIFMTQALRVFHGNLDLKIHLLDSKKPKSWPSINANPPPLILGFTSNGLLEEQ
jgi:hypothetical protein